jgi:hypothetical protein
LSKDYDHEFGYETLLSDFKRYNKQTPKGVTLVREGRNIYLQFKTTNKPRSKYKCDCSFTLDGMVEALSKAHKVADKLKESSSETEFWQWYDSTIKQSVNLKDDQLTFQQAIALVYNDFWGRNDRRKETNLGTTVKTGARLARPMFSTRYPNLYSDWELEYPRLPDNKPKEGSNFQIVCNFHGNLIRNWLARWNAPFTQTHADRRLGNLLGEMSGVPQEIRARSMQGNRIKKLELKKT